MQRPGSWRAAALAVALAAVGLVAGAWLASHLPGAAGASLAWTGSATSGRVPLLRVSTFLGRRRAVGPNFHHPRCTNCHGFNVPNAIGQIHIDQGRLPPAHQCTDCHTVPGWHAPAAIFDLASKTLPEVCVFVKDHTANDPVIMASHLKEDPLIQWAVGDGVRPDGKLAPEGKAPPGDLTIWHDWVDRWTTAGMPCE